MADVQHTVGIEGISKAIISEAKSARKYLRREQISQGVLQVPPPPPPPDTLPLAQPSPPNACHA